MKFYIDDNEIKTVNKNAMIEGSLGLVARTASFSYIYNPNDSDVAEYKAKIGSSVLIKNDNGKKLFKGIVTKINYMKGASSVQIGAHDLLFLLLNEPVKGRVKGKLKSVLSKTAEKFSIVNGLITILAKKINILSLGELSAYDVISIAAKKLFGDEFQLYLDGDSKIKILLPTSRPTEELVIGEDIISASFSGKFLENSAQIKAMGNDEIVSGTVIKIVDPNNDVSGEFVVRSDRHIYGAVYTMDLELKERTLS